jgi:nucleotide-binding universal stress UspA family protein
MKILLAIDNSPESQTALQEMAAREWPPGSLFEVISVVEPSHLWATSEIAQESAARAKETVESAVARLRELNLEATGDILTGNPKTAIVDRARTGGADFVAVASHGVSALTRFLMGGVAASVLRYAPCSVEVVRPKTGGTERGFRILLATDGSDCSNAAARSIADRPWPAGTEVEVLSVVELTLPAGRALFEPPFLDSSFVETARGEAMKRAQDSIAHARQVLSGAGLVSSESISVLAEPPKTIILDEATRWDADLIVLGSHGRHGVDRFLLGSVSEAVALHADCSVEVIRIVKDPLP